MSKITQEFYCNDCDGYFFVTFNIALNQEIGLVCPNCKRRHPRTIKDGCVSDGPWSGYSNYYSSEEILVPQSAYHKKPFVSVKDSRNGHAVDPVMRARWLETIKS